MRPNNNNNWAHSKYIALANISHSHYVVILQGAGKLVTRVRVMLP